MKKIDELLDDYNMEDEKIYIKEEFITKEERDRIKKLTLEKAGYNQKSIKKRYIIPLVAAMTLILSFAVVFAQGGLSNIYYMIFGENAKYASELGTEINESYSCNGLTLNVASMIGDENSFYIIFEIIDENGKSFKDLYIDFENFYLDLKSIGSYGYSLHNIEDDDENDNKATVLLIGDTNKKAAGKKMTVNAKNITFYNKFDSENKIITEGEWSVTFKADYKNTSKTIRVNKGVTIDNKRYTVKELKLSPISLNIELINDLGDKIKNPVSSLHDKATVTMKDGKNIDLVSSGTSTNILKSTINSIFEKPVDIKQIESVNIGDLVIKINE